MNTNTWDKCKNCGGDRAIHHYETDQCSLGGREASIGRKQEWKSTTFEIETKNEVDELRKSIKKLLARVEELEAQVKRLQSEESVRIHPCA